MTAPISPTVARCLFCDGVRIATVDSRRGERPGWRRRRKKCLDCDQRWTSVELPIDDIKTILHITTNLDTLGALALKLHKEIEAMQRLGDKQREETAEVVSPLTNEPVIREMELSDL